MKYLVLADVHANLSALEAVLETETDWDEVVFLGDAVDWGPQPNPVVERLSSLPGRFVMGNHDRKMLSDPDATPPAGRENFTEWTRSKLTSSNTAIIGDYRESETIRTGNKNVRIHHGDFDIGRLTARTDLDSFGAIGERFEAPIVMFGHSHQQFHLIVDGTRFVNPGSVGRSNRRGINAQYATLEDGRIDLHETHYDAEPTVAAMERLSIDSDRTIWQQCLRRELFRMLRECGGIPDESDVSNHSRYELAHFQQQFGSWSDALETAGFSSE